MKKFLPLAVLALLFVTASDACAARVRTVVRAHGNRVVTRTVVRGRGVGVAAANVNVAVAAPVFRTTFVNGVAVRVRVH